VTETKNSSRRQETLLASGGRGHYGIGEDLSGGTSGLPLRARAASRRPLRIHPGALAVVLAALVVVFARAASPEQDYLAIRDRAIAALNKDSGPIGKRRLAEEQAVRADLVVRLRRLLGPIVPEGFVGRGELSPESLFADDEGAAALDGLTYHSLDKKATLLATSPALARAWLKARDDLRADFPNGPNDLAAALKVETFFTQAFSEDAAVSFYAELSIDRALEAETAVAFLALRRQAIFHAQPDEIIVATLNNESLLLAHEPAVSKPAPIAACETLWQSYKKKIDEANRDEGEGKSDVVEALGQLEEEADRAFRDCYRTRLSGEPVYAALLRQAQTLGDRLARRPDPRAQPSPQ
jgi:hypothetical protein